jgi:hypothetical protein
MLQIAGRTKDLKVVESFVLFGCGKKHGRDGREGMERKENRMNKRK